MSETANNAQRNIESKDDFEDDKAGQWKKWGVEVNAANTAVKKFHKQGHKTVAKFLNDAKASEFHAFRLNIFYSNITTVKAMMFGKLPEITFSRVSEDFNDDAARVAGMMLQRMLSADIGTPNDQYSESLKQNLEDRLLPGLGVSRVRYEFDEETVQVAAVIDQQSGETIEAASTTTQITNERAPLDYVYWRDFGWSPARTWAEVRWISFKTLMTRDELVARFGKKLGEAIPLTASKFDWDDTVQDQNDPKQDAWMRAEILEIWDKESKQVCWWCKDFPTILDKKDDPLGLSGFFPIPEPMSANVTTSAYMPIPDYIMAQDLYSEIDQLETRISKITEAIKVVGVYDQSAEGVKRMLTEGVENDLIPVDNWAMFAEKGGLQGTIDWLPIKEIAETLGYLIERRNDAKGLLYEITGISDIMRGATASGGAVSATERALEARFSSVRIQALQDEFAKFATDLIRLRAEVISLHFQPQSIVTQSNIEHTPDAELIEPAIQLIKESRKLIWRIQVKPESVAMVDYAQLKEERTAYITGVATFLQSASPLIEMSPEAAPILMEMLKWGLAGFKGSNEVEGIMDQAITQMQQPQPEGEGEDEPPSPEEIKAQMEQAKQAHEMQMKQMEGEATDRKWQYEQQEAQQQHQLKLEIIEAENQASIREEQAQATLNIAEQESETIEVMKRETHKADEAIRVQRSKPVVGPR